MSSPDSRLNPWEREASGTMKRNLNYTITINNPLIGKFSTATENQVCVCVCVWGGCSDFRAAEMSR